MDHEPDGLVKSSKSLWLQNSIITFLTFVFWQTRCFAINPLFYFVGLRLSFWFVVKQKPRLPAEMDVPGDTIPLKKPFVDVFTKVPCGWLSPQFRQPPWLGGSHWQHSLGSRVGRLRGTYRGLIPDLWTRGICFFNFSKQDLRTSVCTVTICWSQVGEVYGPPGILP